MSGAVWLMLLLLAVSGVFAGAEAALFTLASRSRRHRPATAERLLKDPAGALTVILLGNLIVNLAYFALSAAWAADLGAEAGMAVAAGAVLALVLGGEILPKVVAHRHPARAGRFLLVPVWLLHALCGPFATWLGNRLAPEQRVQEPVDPATADRLIQAEGEALLSKEEQGLLRQILELGTLRAGAVRRSLAETLLLPWETPLAEARKRLRREGVSWCGLTDPRGEIRGVLDMTRWPAGRTAREAMQPVPILPEVGSVSHGVRLLRESGAPCVLLVDEYGDSAGIIERGRWADTLLDRIPEQPAGRLPAIVPLGSGRFQVDASLPLHVFRERFADPGEVDARTDTVGGLVLERLGRVPRPGDRLRLGGYQSGVDLLVVRCDGVRPVELEVREVAPNDGSPATHPLAGTE